MVHWGRDQNGQLKWKLLLEVTIQAPAQPFSMMQLSILKKNTQCASQPHSLWLLGSFCMQASADTGAVPPGHGKRARNSKIEAATATVIDLTLDSTQAPHTGKDITDMST